MRIPEGDSFNLLYFSRSIDVSSSGIICLLVTEIFVAEKLRANKYQHTPYISQWRRKWQPTPVLLPGESLGQRNLAAHRVTVSLTQLKCLSAQHIYPKGSQVVLVV